LAIRIVEEFDFSHGLYHLRLPGYPIFLASVFALFDEASPWAIMAIQHLMVVGCAGLSVLIGWMLWPSRVFAAIVGLLTGVSLHLSGYANAILTEVPYAFVLTGLLFLILRHWVTGRIRWLLAASAVAGVAAMIKDVGQYAILVCAAAAVVTAFKHRQKYQGQQAKQEFAATRGPLRRWVRRLGPAIVGSIAPAIIVLAPMMIHNCVVFGRPKTTANGGLLFYYRAACLDKLDSMTSESVAILRRSVEIARTRGSIPPDATHHNYLPTLSACERLRGHRGSVFESSHLLEIARIMKQAGIDIMLEHPATIAKNTVLYTYRILMMPDEGYRMQPGGRFRDSRLATGATIFANDTYLSSIQAKIGEQELAVYLPFSNQPRRTTKAWSAVTGWYHQRIEKGAPIIGLLDSPYEEFMALSALGLAMAAVWRRRFGFLLLAFVIFYHAAGSAFMGGVQPRYVVPLHPLLQILAAVPISEVVLAAIAYAPRWIKPRPAGQLAPARGHLSEHRAQAR